MVVDASLRSLEQGRRDEPAVVAGAEIDVPALIREKIGDAAEDYLRPRPSEPR